MGYIDDYIKSISIDPIGTVYTGSQEDNKQRKLLDSLAASAESKYGETQTGIGYNLSALGDANKYNDLGLSQNVQLLEALNNDTLNDELSEQQSNLAKVRNALIQSASELTLGTVKSFADLFDLATFAQLRDENDYQNPVSTLLEEWQENVRQAAPIYAKDGDIRDPNSWSVGFFASGVPSIVTSLTLLIPSKAVTVGLTKGLGWATSRGIKFLRNLEKANKAINDGEKLSRVAKINAFINSPAGKTTKEVGDFVVGGLTSRLLENYQEGRQVYNDAVPKYTELWNNMTDEQKVAAIQRLKALNGEDAADWNNPDSIIRLAASNAADETFMDDMWNAGFDIYQMYGLAKPFRAINGPSRAALRRLQKNQIKFLDKNERQIEEILAKRTRLQKVSDKASDFLFGAKHTLLGSLSEGVEEAVNYIAQEEGMTYGKMLLDGEERLGFGTRLKEYTNAPELWNSAFWGVIGGLVFEVGGEKVNRLSEAKNIVNKAKKINDITGSTKVPTFWEAYKMTENDVRTQNLKERLSKYQQIQKELKDIEDGKDIDKITQNGKLETDEEIKAARDYHFQKFVDETLLDAADAGNFDLAVEFLESKELSKAFVDAGHMTQQEMDKLRENIKKRGETIISKYNSQLRNIYNAVSGWGENNDADLSTIPAEVFNIIARNNISHELTAEYYQSQIDAINSANTTLEQDVADKLKEAGIDFKSAIDLITTAHQLGMINAQIERLDKTTDSTTLTGQKELRVLRLQKKLLEDRLTNERIINADGTKEDKIGRLARIIVGLQTASSVDVVQGTGTSIKNPAQYEVNPTNPAFNKFRQAIESRDKAIISQLNPVIKEILDSTADEDIDNLLSRTISMSNVINQNIGRLYNDKGEAELLVNINKQLASNYSNLAIYDQLRDYELKSRSITRDEILADAHEITNFIQSTRISGIENANSLLHQLSKKYGKDNILAEVDNFVNGRKGQTYHNFDTDEKEAFDYYVKLLNLTKPENDVLFGDLKKSLDKNDMYEFTKDDDIIERIRKHREEEARKAREKSTTSENQESAERNKSSINESSEESEKENEEETPLNEPKIGNEPIPLEENEDGEGIIELDDNNAPKDDSESSEDKESTIPPTGGVTEDSLSEDELIASIQDAIKQVSSSTGNPVNDPDVIAAVKDEVKRMMPDLSDDYIEMLTQMAVVNASISNEYIESLIANNVISYSTVAVSDAATQAAAVAKRLINENFNKLLDTFNTYFGRGTVNGKRVIHFESLLRYAKSITNNNHSAEEVFEAFTNIINSNPDKYTVIYENTNEPAVIINKVAQTLTERRSEINSNVGGRNFNFTGRFEQVSESEKKEIEKIINNLKLGDRITCKLNYRKETDNYPSGIDFIVKNEKGEEIIIAQAPTSMEFGGDHWAAGQNGWFHQFAFDIDNHTEYATEKFLKDLLTSADTNAVEFVKGLREYESLKWDEYKALEPTYVAKYYPYLEKFAREHGYNIDNPKKPNYLYHNKSGNNAARFRHISALDFFCFNEEAITLEALGFKKRSKEDINEDKRKSIALWFDKMTESSNSRAEIVRRAKSNNGTTEITIDKVGMLKLIRTTKDKAAPVSMALSKESRATAKLAAGNPMDTSSVVVSGQNKPFNIIGQNTKGRSVVIIEDGIGNQVYVNAYPITFKSPLINNHVKIKAFKTTIETKLIELLDEWRDTKDSTNLQEFITQLVGGERQGVKHSLFRGFIPQPIPNNPNGFRIPYLVKDGEILPPNYNKTEGDGAEVHYLNFFDSISTKNGERKARAAVQDFIPGTNNNRATVWNSKPNDTSNIAAQELLKQKILDVVVNSMMFKIDPFYINADNNSNITHSGIAERDSEGNFILRINGIKNPPKSLSEYITENGDIVIGDFGSYGDFILNNDLVNLTTESINDSNFMMDSNDNSQFGVTYTLDAIPPVEEPMRKPTPITSSDTVTPTTKQLVKDIINKGRTSKRGSNISKQILTRLAERLGKDNSLNSISRSKLINSILHDNVKEVENFNGATITRKDGSTTIVPDTASAMYLYDNIKITTSDGKEYSFKRGDIVVGDIFMNWVDGTNIEVYNAIRALIHENLHAAMDDNILNGPESNDRLLEGLEEIYNEYRKNRPDGSYPTRDLTGLKKGEKVNILEDFLIDSLTNFELIKDLNEITAENIDVSNKHKSLFSKLLDKFINWLSDFLGKDFKFNKESLLSEEYNLFEDTLNNFEIRSETSEETNISEETTIEPSTEKIGIDNSSIDNISIDDLDNTEIFSTVPAGMPSVKSMMSNLDSETRADVIEKINNGVLSITCK